MTLPAGVNAGFATSGTAGVSKEGARVMEAPGLTVAAIAPVKRFASQASTKSCMIAITAKLTKL